MLESNGEWMAAGHSENFQIQLYCETICKRTNSKEVNYYLHLKKVRNPFAPELVEQKDGTIILENLLYGYCLPCFMDVKMGTHTYEENAPFLKRFYMNLKDLITTSRRKGYFLSGYKKYDIKKSKFIKKGYFRCLFEYPSAVLPENDDRSVEITQSYLDQLINIEKWMYETCRDEFISSSLFFIHEGEPNRNANPKVFMIDFAHVAINKFEKDDSPDSNYMLGLENLQEHFTIHLER